MFKLKHRNILILLALSFCILGFISSVSACEIVEKTEIDSGNKVFKSNNKVCYISWSSDKLVKYNEIDVYVSFKSINKKNKKNNLYGSGFVNIEKISKNIESISKIFKWA